MTSVGGGAGSAAVAGVLSSPPVALLHRGAYRFGPKAPVWALTATCGTSVGGPCRRHRLAASSTPSPSGGNGGVPATNIATATTTATTAMTQYTAGSALPWKVQWQLQVSATTVQVVEPSASASSSGSTDFQQQQQQQQLSWTPFDRAESVRRAALEASGWEPELFNARLADLAAVLPDLPRVLPSLSPALLVAAMSDTHAMAAKVVRLKTALPSTNVGMLLLLHPPFLDPAVGPERLLAGVEHAGRVLGGAAVAEEVLQWYPPLMDPDVLDASIAQLKRLVPHLARSCLPSAAAAASGGRPSGPGSSGGGDARQLVHLLGIVMQREGSGLKGPEEDAGGALWWGCS
ncbi:hypothetical protein PLESTB_000627400 [Pleodorina starrii]|uniref:Uncharacterized protein n=1 Tax=Pleodorina starrii TaxID=330485 RepID=A0A9W6BHQ7_9CHLO|nr:hypothetical protein PLESTM_000990000 [Pleodorina starrii]GLC52421.1 hypothetical protein PLESTB_000627400 [Pleodorina starrii]GLC70086.1 hypothetical protein PLESTF_000922600 [Pleodorina starrii]